MKYQREEQDQCHSIGGKWREEEDRKSQLPNEKFAERNKRHLEMTFYKPRKLKYWFEREAWPNLSNLN